MFQLPLRAFGIALLAGIAAAAALFPARATAAAKRVAVQGSDVLLDGKPYIPHGMCIADPNQFPALAKMNVNSVQVDLPFDHFDPRKSDAENRQAYADFLKEADAAQANGMTVLWLLSFHYTPDWLWERYPDVRMKQYDGSDGAGGWMKMCLNHPGFRADAEQWLTFIARMLGPHPATIGFVLWNEPHLTSEVDYNPHTIAAFHAWLKKRYGKVKDMNAIWQTSYAGFDDVQAPPPRASTHWYEVYDKLVSDVAQQPATTQAGAGNSALWMDWMRFRQQNFADFFTWEAGVLRKADPGALITSKIVALELYTSHAYGVGTNTEMWANSFLDVLGMDLYAHLDENFLARWKCDFFQGMSAGNKPIWHTEMNFTFLKERGLPTPQQWRTAVYYQLARGVNGFWDFMWNDDAEYTLHYKGNKPAHVTHEIARVGQELKTLAPLLAGLKPQAAQVAVLHSTTTGLAMSGDHTPTADLTTLIDLLYRSHTPFRYVTEDMVRNGALKDYRVLIAVGTVAVDDGVLEAIRKFADENGGHVIANARFAELDEHAVARAQHPPPWMGATARAFHRQLREKTGTLALHRSARSVEDQPIDVDVKLDTWGGRPIKLADGPTLAAGHIFGDEDTQLSWSSQGRHEMYWEDVEPAGDGQVIGTFGDDGKPAIISTPQTVYIARDTDWVDEEFEKWFARILSAAGVRNANSVVLRDGGRPAPHVDLRMWQAPDRKVLFVINSAPTLHYDGSPVNVNVTFDAFGDIADALTGKVITSRWDNFKRVIPMTLKAGEVRVLVGKPYPDGWQNVRQKYDEVIEHFRPNTLPYVTWRRSDDELWVYDNRTELGVGTHDVKQYQFDLMRALGIRLVRYTVYWNKVEQTEAPGVYDEQELAGYDDAVRRAKESGIELELVVHAEPPGSGWPNRHEAYRRFADFMTMLARRYPSVRYWELWNEMETGFTDLFGARRPDYAMFERGRCYAQMLKVAYPAIKQANPQAWVLLGGLSSGNVGEFIHGMYQEGGRDYFDFMNIHTYGVPVNWGMMLYAYQARQAMACYGDENRPMWNTEFGIDAGNMWRAWKRTTASQFDEGHLDAWRTCIEESKKHHMYWKILPYQFYAGNESATSEMEDPSSGVQLPEGSTLDDYGFGVVRSDGKTPRPTYQWLLKEQVNRPIATKPRFTADVEVPWDGGWEPEGYAFEAAGGDRIVIKNVEIDSLEPTVIRLKPSAGAHKAPPEPQGD